MRIPKDDRDATKLKGFGYVEFEDRDSLLNALVIPDTTLKNRRIRIEVAANSENDRRRGRMDMGRDRQERSESFGDWRSGPRTENSDGDRKGGFGREREGGFTRDNMRGGDREERSFNREERSFNRDNMRGGEREDRSFNRDGMRDRDSGFTRDRDNKDGYRRDKEGLDDRPGGWREGERANRDPDRAGFTRDRGAFRDSDRGGRFEDREERRGFGGRRFDNDRDRNGGFTRGGDRESDSTPSEPRERPKLILAPRTKPVENVPVKAETVPSASIFGKAKPVDTSQREREIEEKLAKGTSGSRDGSKDRRAHSTEDIDKATEKPRLARKIEDTERPRPARKIEDSPKRSYEEKKVPRSEHKSPDKNDNRHKVEKPRKEEKRERHEKEMPKFAEPEPPNFAANNKFAFLQNEDFSD